MDTKTLDEINKLIEIQNQSIELGRSLSNLEKNPDFKKIINDIYIGEGTKILWDNIRLYEEADMLDKGSVRAENIGKFKVEIQARLILKRFFDIVRIDADNAPEALQELTQEKENILKENN